jgi:hypothetical protein
MPELCSDSSTYIDMDNSKPHLLLTSVSSRKHSKLKHLPTLSLGSSDIPCLLVLCNNALSKVEIEGMPLKFLVDSSLANIGSFELLGARIYEIGSGRYLR